MVSVFKIIEEVLYFSCPISIIYIPRSIPVITHSHNNSSLYIMLNTFLPPVNQNTYKAKYMETWLASVCVLSRYCIVLLDNFR